MSETVVRLETLLNSTSAELEQQKRLNHALLKRKVNTLTLTSYLLLITLSTSLYTIKHESTHVTLFLSSLVPRPLPCSCEIRMGTYGEGLGTRLVSVCIHDPSVCITDSEVFNQF